MAVRDSRKEKNYFTFRIGIGIPIPVFNNLINSCFSYSFFYLYIRMLSFGDRRWLDGGFGNAVSGAGYGAGWDGNSRTSKSSSTQGPLPSSRVHTVGGSNLRISDHDDRVFRDPERHSSKQSDDGDDSIADGDFSKEILYSLNGVSILLGVIMIIFAGILLFIIFYYLLCIDIFFSNSSLYVVRFVCFVGRLGK